MWDEIANKYDAVFAPGATDEAPVGIESTGDAVRSSTFPIRPIL